MLTSICLQACVCGAIFGESGAVKRVFEEGPSSGLAKSSRASTSSVSTALLTTSSVPEEMDDPKVDSS